MPEASEKAPPPSDRSQNGPGLSPMDRYSQPLPGVGPHYAADRVPLSVTIFQFCFPRHGIAESPENLLSFSIQVWSALH